MPFDKDSLSNSGKALEDRFFLERDRVLVQKRQELKKLEETKQALSAVSGITNQAVLQKLVDLGIQAELVTSLAVVPLVEVAWADGRVEDKEREAIMQAATKEGFAQGSPDHAILDRWLAQRPGEDLLEAWTHYVEGLCELMSPEEQNALKRDLLDRARRVAEAAGGFLGLTSRVSDGERRMLEKLDRAFCGKNRVG